MISLEKAIANVNKREFLDAQQEIIANDNKVANASAGKNKDSEARYLRDFSLAAVEFARKEFPAARSMTDAVTAYIYVTSGREFDVPDRIKKLAKTWTGDNKLDTMNDRLNRIEKLLKEILRMAEENHLLILYLLFDRLGFRHENPRTPDKVNLMEPGMEALIESAKRQAAEFRKKCAQKEGRPQKQHNE